MRGGQVMQIEHPLITKVEQTGYPNMVKQPEHNGIDYFGDEILQGDEVVFDPENDEVILKCNLEKYLEKMFGFDFTLAQ